jgi:ABC-type glycerol-3-phosphate transport system permease component
LWPLIILKSPENFTLPLTINSLSGPVGRTVYNVQMAASVISVLPLLLIFIIFQRRFVEGIQAGAIRGAG